MSVDTSAITKAFGAISTARILPAIITFIVAYFVLKVVVKVVGNLLDRTPMEKTIVRFIRSSLRIVMWVLISTHPFRVGDFVEVGGVSGTVQEIGMTYTTLTTADQKEIFVPNSEISSSKIINYTAMTSRRVDLTFTASYDDAVEDVKAALLKAAMLPQVQADPAPFVAVSNYGDSAIEYVVRVWTSSDDYWNVYYAIIEQVKVCFDEAGITMTYPHLNVHLDRGEPAQKS